ncbi:MAG: metallophosphoesterase family protein [Bacteroidetes bacterium]|nr:metallophosphoesterase family protein [Bacteroidota bacterium]
MVKIGLLSDTHGFLHPRTFEFFRDCDEVWHAGDIGTITIAEELRRFRPFRAVFGNIDGQEVRISFPEEQVFDVEKVRVVMTHIGGGPGRYEKKAIELIHSEKPGLFITGHSHILRVIYDKANDLLYINPGAAGKYGFHKSITMVRFVIDGDQMKDMEVLDIPRSSED